MASEYHVRNDELIFRTATGELVKGGKRMQIVGCDDWGIQSQDSRCSSTGVQTTVVCWRIHDEGVESLCCMVTKVTCSTKVRMLQRKLMLGSRRS